MIFELIYCDTNWNKVVKVYVSKILGHLNGNILDNVLR